MNSILKALLLESGGFIFLAIIGCTAILKDIIKKQVTLRSLILDIVCVVIFCSVSLIGSRPIYKDILENKQCTTQGVVVEISETETPRRIMPRIYCVISTECGLLSLRSPDYYLLDKHDIVVGNEYVFRYHMNSRVIIDASLCSPH